MKKRLLLTIIVLALAMMLAVPAYASPPTTVQGDIIPLGPDTGLTTGALSGSYTIVNVENKVSRLYFEGTINGASGSLTLNLVNIGPNGLGYWTILDGSGDLANLHGHGTFMFPTETAGAYEGQVHFDP